MLSSRLENFSSKFYGVSAEVKPVSTTAPLVMEFGVCEFSGRLMILRKHLGRNSPSPKRYYDLLCAWGARVEDFSVQVAPFCSFGFRVQLSSVPTWHRIRNLETTDTYPQEPMHITRKLFLSLQSPGFLSAPGSPTSVKSMSVGVS